MLVLLVVVEPMNALLFMWGSLSSCSCFFVHRRKYINKKGHRHSVSDEQSDFLLIVPTKNKGGKHVIPSVKNLTCRPPNYVRSTTDC